MLTRNAAVIRVSRSSKPDVVLDATALKAGAPPSDFVDDVVGHEAAGGAEI